MSLFHVVYLYTTGLFIMSLSSEDCGRGGNVAVAIPKPDDSAGCWVVWRVSGGRFEGESGVSLTVLFSDRTKTFISLLHSEYMLLPLCFFLVGFFPLNG